MFLKLDIVGFVDVGHMVNSITYNYFDRMDSSGNFIYVPTAGNNITYTQTTSNTTYSMNNVPVSIKLIDYIDSKYYNKMALKSYWENLFYAILETRTR